MSEEDLKQAMNEELSSPQREYLLTALSYGNWEYDDTPYYFKHPNDGMVIWLKSLVSRLRISSRDARLYTNPRRPREATTWKYQDSEGLVKFESRVKDIARRQAYQKKYNASQRT